MLHRQAWENPVGAQTRGVTKTPRMFMMTHTRKRHMYVGSDPTPGSITSWRNKPHIKAMMSCQPWQQHPAFDAKTRQKHGQPNSTGAHTHGVCNKASNTPPKLMTEQITHPQKGRRASSHHSTHTNHTLRHPPMEEGGASAGAGASLLWLYLRTTARFVFQTHKGPVVRVMNQPRTCHSRPFQPWERATAS